ncbi:MAG: hypothetical protein J6S90_06210, partial [Lentisphaeria bacterium]|nr:hypothetical protein [Lentisphaeria bacterium]
IENAEKLSFLISECRSMGITILPPDINSSGINFSVDKGRIRFGLGAIKGCGEAAASKIIASRKADGKFTSFLDFCERCGSDVNSRMLEYMTRAGALDALGLRRSQILAIAEPMIAFATQRAKEKAQGQGSLFDMLGGAESEDVGDAGSVPIPDIPEFDWEEILSNEKELLGFYVSGHPLDRYAGVIKTFARPIRTLEELSDNSCVRLAGMVGSFTKKFGKASGKPFGVLQLEDLDATCECMAYERALKNLAESQVKTEPGTPILIEATVSRKDEAEKPRIMIDRFYSLEDAPAHFSEEFYLHLRSGKYSRKDLETLTGLFSASPGKTKLMICLVKEDDSVVFIESHMGGITVTSEIIGRIEALFGKDSYRIKPAPDRKPFVRKWTPKPSEQEQAKSGN